MLVPVPMTRRTRAVAAVSLLVAVALGVMWSRLPPGGLGEALLSRACRCVDTTTYAALYSDASFGAVRAGMVESDVRSRIGEPLGEAWFYGPAGNRESVLYFEGGVLVKSDPPQIAEAAGRLPVDKAHAAFGEPAERSLAFSESRSSGSYRVRVVLIREGRVTGKIASFYVD